MLLLKVQEFAYLVFEPRGVGYSPRLFLEGSFRVVEHAVTEAHTTVVAAENVVVLASFAAFPEFLVLGEFRECHGLVTQT